MNTLLIDFLNHGVLPFVGRSHEVDRIVSFWRETTEATRLRMAVLTGEAGIGKSRLAEECVAAIEQAGGVAVHAKMPAEPAVSLVSIVGRALRLATVRHRLPAPSQPATLDGIAAELRQLAHTRPTLLILEDIHLLAGAALEEFAYLANALADEVLAVLTLARPLNLPARAVLEHHGAERIHLGELDENDLDRLWELLFGTPPDPEIARVLHDATNGNPLAIRSAISGAVRSGVLAFSAAAGSWRTTIPLTALRQALHRNVELLAEGMAAILNERERSAAIRLASLGEVFSPEAAHALVPDAGEILPALTAKAILASAAAVPLAGMVSISTPLTFTYGILHSYLFRQAHTDPSYLVRALASGAPLYSVLPFQILAHNTGPIGITAGESGEAIRHALNTAIALDGSPAWQLGIEAWNAAETIGITCAGAWSNNERRQLHAEIVSTRLVLMRRSGNPDDYEPFVQRLLGITEGAMPPALRQYRLKAFTHVHALERLREPAVCRSTCRDTWEGAEQFVTANPDIRHDPAYLDYLDSAARSMLYGNDLETLGHIEKQFWLLASDQNAPENYRNQAKQAIALQFLDVFGSEEELEARFRLMGEVEPIIDKRRRMRFTISKIVLLFSTGRMAQVVESVEPAIPQFRAHGLPNNFFYGSLCRLCALAALGDAIDEIAQQIEHLCESAPQDINPFPLFARMAIVEQALLVGDRDWLQSVRDGYAEAIRNLRPETQIALALELGAGRDSIPPVAHTASAAFAPFASIFTAEAPGAAAITVALQQALSTPILRTSDLIEKRAALASLPDLSTRHNLPELAGPLANHLRDALVRTLEWLDQRALPAYMAPFLDLHGYLLTVGELSNWRDRMGALTRQPRLPSDAGTAAHAGRLRLTMLGSIELHLADGTTIPVRGTRLRTLIGLLVADRMLDEPLGHREFSSIVAGIHDPDKARKTLNGVVFRLRDLLGHEAILTHDDTPRLNLALLDVDLLEANTSLREAAQAFREKMLTRAQRRLLQALSITQGSVAFPTLYEDFFEATRVAFENQLRSLLLKVGKGLLAERDAKSAEDLLHNGFAAMPGDEELAELLCEALVMNGKRTEAERVRMRIME